jgi:uncharacterized protein YkwD
LDVRTTDINLLYRHNQFWLILLVVLAMAGCTELGEGRRGNGSGGSDSGRPDAGTTDSGSDTGATRDGGTPDRTNDLTPSPDVEPTIDTRENHEPDIPEVDVGECGAQAVSNDLPVRVTGHTAGGISHFSNGGCGDGLGNSPDSVFVFTAPFAGPYVISTVGSGYDTVAYAIDDSCSGSVLACNDDIDDSLASGFRVQLRDGQRILIVVDGYDGDSGDFVLEIEGREQVCDDDNDDDGDGLVDCDDPDCYSVECVAGGSWPSDSATREERMLVAVNRQRAAGVRCGADWFDGAEPLEMDDLIQLAARLHSLDMATENYFEHDSLDGREFSDRMAATGYRGEWPWAENIQAGSDTAEDASQRLYDSAGHCRNLMNPEYQVIGIGYAYDSRSDYGHYWTQDFGGSH